MSLPDDPPPPLPASPPSSSSPSSLAQPPPPPPLDDSDTRSASSVIPPPSPSSLSSPSPPPLSGPWISEIVLDANASACSDPPPPYPSSRVRDRDSTRDQRRDRATRRHTCDGTGRSFSSYASASTTPHSRTTSDVRDVEDDDDGDEDTSALVDSTASLCPHSVHGYRHPTRTRTQTHERTPLLSASATRAVRRSRSGSGSDEGVSIRSAAPSLARTVLSLFRTDDAGDFGDGAGARGGEDAMAVARREVGPGEQEEGGGGGIGHARKLSFGARCKRYFRPMRRAVYYRSLVHLLFVNFPYALIAWVYLFVFTVTGTTLLVALPLGAVLCFFNLLGARALSSGELSLQIKFHAPFTLLGHQHLHHHHFPMGPYQYRPLPIFYRMRPMTPSEIEERGGGERDGVEMVQERSFYKNTYAMFTDPTSYQALFYFIVVKPAITLLTTILFWGLGVPLMVLILPAPSVLRAARRIGVWQASVAVEGLYLPVR